MNKMIQVKTMNERDKKNFFYKNWLVFKCKLPKYISPQSKLVLDSISE